MLVLGDVADDQWLVWMCCGDRIAQSDAWDLGEVGADSRLEPLPVGVSKSDHCSRCREELRRQVDDRIE